MTKQIPSKIPSYSRKILWTECTYPSKIWVLKPSTLSAAAFWERVPKDVIKVKEAIRVGPDLKGLVSL